MLAEKKVVFFSRNPERTKKSTCLDFIEKEDEFFLLIVSTLFVYVWFLLCWLKALSYTCLKKGKKPIAKMLADFTISIIIEYAFSISFYSLRDFLFQMCFLKGYCAWVVIFYDISWQGHWRGLPETRHVCGSAEIGI